MRAQIGSSLMYRIVSDYSKTTILVGNDREIENLLTKRFIYAYNALYLYCFVVGYDIVVVIWVIKMFAVLFCLCIIEKPQRCRVVMYRYSNLPMCFLTSPQGLHKT